MCSPPSHRLDVGTPARRNAVAASRSAGGDGIASSSVDFNHDRHGCTHRFSLLVVHDRSYGRRSCGYGVLRGCGNSNSSGGRRELAQPYRQKSWKMWRTRPLVPPRSSQSRQQSFGSRPGIWYLPPTSSLHRWCTHTCRQPVARAARLERTAVTCIYDCPVSFPRYLCSLDTR